MSGKKGCAFCVLLAALVFAGCGTVKKEAQKVAPVEESVQVEKKTETEMKTPDLNVNPYHPVVFYAYYGEQDPAKAVVLGGYQNNRWFGIKDVEYIVDGMPIGLEKIEENQFKEGALESQEVECDLLKGNEIFKFYSKTKQVDTASGNGKATMWISPASGQGNLSIVLDKLDIDSDFVIGINGEWDGRPRIPKAIDDHSFEVDLDNDGVIEMVQFLVRKSEENDNKAVLTVKKEGQVVEGGEWYLFDSEKLDDINLMTLDVNGDGNMELIVDHVGPAGSISVIEYSENKLNTVLNYDSGE